jgi:nucleoside-diphosphate-sugar epimerase
MSLEHVLVTGATGLVGRSAMQHYAEQGYKVTAVSRRKPLNTYGASWISLDLADAEACKKALSPLTDIVQIVFAALHEETNLTAGWLQREQIDRNEAMLRNTVEAIAPHAPGLRNVTILQGPKAYGVHVHPIRPGAREDRDEDRSIPNFYWAQEDYLKVRQKGQLWGWNVLRPALVIGLNVAGAMNIYAAIGVYAAVLKERGEPLYYPGEGLAIGEATDADLIARACEWVLHEPKAKNQCYNLTNGEFSSLKEEWHVIAEAVGMKPGPEKPFSFVKDLPECSEEWNRIRERYHLKTPGLQDFLGQSTQFADVIFARRSKPPSAMSCIKIRRDGFGDVLYTDEMIRKWFKMYQDEKLLPPV